MKYIIKIYRKGKKAFFIIAIILLLLGLLRIFLKQSYGIDFYSISQLVYFPAVVNDYKIPESFPDSIPLTKDGRIWFISDLSNLEERKNFVSFQFYTKEDLGYVKDYYDNLFKNYGWTKVEPTKNLLDIYLSPNIYKREKETFVIFTLTANKRFPNRVSFTYKNF